MTQQQADSPVTPTQQKGADTPQPLQHQQDGQIQLTPAQQAAKDRLSRYYELVSVAQADAIKDRVIMGGVGE